VVGKKREREKVAMEKKGEREAWNHWLRSTRFQALYSSSHSTPEQKDGHGNSINDETGGGAYV
jgi:hypothetical protein